MRLDPYPQFKLTCTKWLADGPKHCGAPGCLEAIDGDLKKAEEEILRLLKEVTT